MLSSACIVMFSTFSYSSNKAQNTNYLLEEKIKVEINAKSNKIACSQIMLMIEKTLQLVRSINIIKNHKLDQIYNSTILYYSNANSAAEIGTKLKNSVILSTEDATHLFNSYILAQENQKKLGFKPNFLEVSRKQAIANITKAISMLAQKSIYFLNDVYQCEFDNIPLDNITNIINEEQAELDSVFDHTKTHLGLILNILEEDLCWKSKNDEQKNDIQSYLENEFEKSKKAFKKYEEYIKTRDASYIKDIVLIPADIYEQIQADIIETTIINQKFGAFKMPLTPNLSTEKIL